MINGFDLKTNRSIELQSEVEEFLKSGGKVKSVEGFSAKPKKFGYANADSIKKDEKKERKTAVDKKADLSRDKRNAITKAESERMRAIQMPILKAYADFFPSFDRWQYLSALVNNAVKSTQLSATCKGKSSIAKPENWEAVKKAINSVISGEIVPDTKGARFLEKGDRLKEQQPLLIAYREKYEGKRSYWGALVKKSGAMIRTTDMSKVCDGRHVLSHDNWLLIKEQILKEI